MRRIFFACSLLFALVGCKGSDDEKFIGTWRVSSTGITRCPDEPAGALVGFAELGYVEIVAGKDSDIVVTDPGDCIVKYDVSGLTAIPLGEQRCKVGNPTRGAITADRAGEKLTMVGTTEFTEKGVTFTCEISDALVRIGK